MRLILFALFVVIPVLEIATFIQVGSVVGLPLTLFGILLTAVIGAFLVRQQGFKALNDARTNMEKQKSPVEQVIHGAFILIAGLMLLTPGFLTDAIGFLFLIPPLRLVVAKKVWYWMKENASVHVATSATYSASYGQTPDPYSRDGGTVIEGEVIEINPADDKPDPSSHKRS